MSFCFMTFKATDDYGVKMHSVGRKDEFSTP